MVGVGDRGRDETNDRFTTRCLGASDHRLLLADRQGPAHHVVDRPALGSTPWRYTDLARLERGF